MRKAITVAEAAVTIDRKGRMVSHLVLEAKPAEPPMGEVELGLTTEPTPGADQAVADQEHPHHQLGIKGLFAILRYLIEIAI